VDEQHWLAERFEADRAHLRAVAYRVLGSRVEADDAVQDAWLRVSRADVSDIRNLTGWFTTIVARICLNALQSRRARGERPLDEQVSEPTQGSDPERDAVLADTVGTALLVVLDTLPPAERLAFVLHDLFAVPFDEIAPVVERSAAAARQLASRGRRRLRTASTEPGDASRQRAVVEAFLAASREGNFEALLTVLDPDVVLRADSTAVQAAVSPAGRRRPGSGPRGSRCPRRVPRLLRPRRSRATRSDQRPRRRGVGLRPAAPGQRSTSPCTPTRSSRSTCSPTRHSYAT